MRTNNKNEEAIFAAAIEIEHAAEREGFVKSACGEDFELLARVEALLKVYYEDKKFLKSPPGVDGMTENEVLSEGPGTRIGRYKLLEMIGEGGFGVVYMAEQAEPIRRRVALKIIKLGMDTKQVIARFEAERQALALMEHPNIAKVLDAGATDTGRPYFVMELVKGIPITEYCDKNNLDTQQRLNLFIEVCKAVQHAHQKGIIHRDIKPTNVMITLRDDGTPVPKIIDFGIAKATGQKLTEKTYFTQFKQFIGTPEYMSPEQAQMGEVDVDTRTDIYSLGVLLYELLTGTTPFNGERLRSSAYDEMLKTIRETEPPRPSTRLNTLGAALTDVAKHRHVQPGELRKIIQGDLDWIVLKTLEKDRSRRYETANELATDIQRHLEDEPVVAGPPSTVYQLHKFVRRNRALVTSVAVVIVVLVAGIVASTIFAVGQARARAEAERQRERAGMNFQMAQDAVDEMTRIAAEQLATVPEMKQIQQQLLQKGQVFYAGFLEENSDDPVVREQICQAYIRLGDIHTALSQHVEAEDSFESAIVIFEEMIADSPNLPDYQAGLAMVCFKLSLNLISHVEEQAIRKGEQTIRRAIEIQERLVDDFPGEPMYLWKLIMMYQRLDLVLRRLQQPEEAQTAVEQSETILGELTDRFAHQECPVVSGGPYVDYKVRITTLGIYQLYLRCDAHDAESDSVFVWIEKLRDGWGEPVADWYLYSTDVDADFGTTPWLGFASFERVMYTGHDTSAVWPILAPGDYTIRLANREDGVAIDALVFQLSDLPEPVENGPEESYVIDETVFVESDGRIVIEAENFSFRKPLFSNWLVVPDENPGDVAHQNFRGTGYIQVLPDHTLSLEERLDYLTRAIEAHPNDATAYYQRGRLYLTLPDHYENALDDFAKVVGFNADYVYAWYVHALAQLGADDTDGYRNACASMLERFGQTEEPGTAHWAAWTCILAPDAIEDLGQAVSLAEQSVESDEKNDQYLNTLGAILYRAGMFNEAVQQLSVLTAEWEQGKDFPTLTSPAYTWFFMAMTHHRLGNSDEATVWLERAVERAEEELAGTPFWSRKLTLQLFHQEAESLIKGEEVEE